MNSKSILFVSCLCASVGAHWAPAAMVITEWAYQGNGGEFVEFTNTGSAAVDMTGWSFDDNTQTAGSVSLSNFGSVAPGESVVLADLTAAAFRTEWGLTSAVKVIGENLQNLGRADEINLYDNTGARIDWLTYDDQAGLGPRTNTASANPLSLSAVGAHDATLWALSSVGDLYGSRLSTSGGLGNPGVFALVPEPASVLLAVLSGALLLATARRARCV